MLVLSPKTCSWGASWVSLRVRSSKVGVSLPWWHLWVWDNPLGVGQGWGHDTEGGIWGGSPEGCPQGTRDVCRNPLFPQPGDTRGSWKALGAQTLQPEGQHVSTNHPECPFSMAWCHLRGRPRCWWLPGLLMGVSSVGPRARGSPGLGSGAGRKPFPGRNSATSTPPPAAWPRIHIPIFDPLSPPRGVLTLFMTIPDPGGEHRP